MTRQDQNSDVGSRLFVTGLCANAGTITPGAQTERPGGVGPLRAAPGGKNLTGRLSLVSAVSYRRAPVRRNQL